MTLNFGSRRYIGVATIFLAAAIGGCGGGGSGGDGGGPVVPTVRSMDPADAATGVAPNSGFAVTFSEAMNPASINASAFTLTGPGAAAVPGSVSFAGVTAVFTPTNNLALNTTYTATIGVGARSYTGLPLDKSVSWKATTSATGDTTRPTVSFTVPANAATGVAINSTIAVTFSKPLNPRTITPVSFTLKRGTAAVLGTVSYAGLTAIFSPTNPLDPNATYTASITSVKDLAGNALATSYTWTFGTGTTADTTAPVVSSTFPSDGATSVATNTAITATFSKPVAPASITIASFTLTAPGAVAVLGSANPAGNTVTFNPTSALAPSTLYTATLTTAVTDLAGNALAANFVWKFTTGAGADTTPPTVVSTSPAGAATGVLTTQVIQAIFSKALAPQTVSNLTFTLAGPGATPVQGIGSFDTQNMVANFQPTNALMASTNYTAKLQGGAGGITDLAGNPLASDYTWSFTTGTHVSLSPVFLGSAGNYVILANSAISTVPPSVITGDVALSPAAESFITGFSLTDATGYATSPQVTGKIFAADQADPTPITLTTAVGDMKTAYTDAATRPDPDFLELGSGAIGGKTLTAGLYKWAGTVTIGSDVTLTGGANDVFIFQISGDLTMAGAKNVFLTGGAKARNVFWQVAGAADAGPSAHFEGIILSMTKITLETGASMNGRLLAQKAVVLQQNALTQPAP